MIPPFKNEALTDFADEKNAAAFAAALSSVESSLGGEHPCLIGGEEVGCEPRLVSINPGETEQVIGRFADAGQAEAEAALEAAWRAFPDWAATPARERALLLIRAAARMRQRKHEFSAMMVLEAGKSWPEADGDTAEAIDFLEFYAREGLRWSHVQPTTPYPGEINEVRYIPLGAGVAIPPWNFPLAIATGMVAAPIAAGNTMVLKPARPTPGIAWMLATLLREVGLPKGVLNYITSTRGSSVGGHLVQHPKTRFISFTGSRAVGCWISEEAGKVRPGQQWLKRVVAEMGGKDAILVDEDADLDAAADAIVRSAFGFQGQKCSACSRVMALQAIYAPLLLRVAERTKRLVQGPPKDRKNGVGPVIDSDAERSILGYIDVGRSEGRLLAGGAKAEGRGYYIQPTVFADVGEGARIANEEIFGPVLAIVPVRDYEHGVAVFNGTDYGLTGGYFGQRHIADAKRRLFCGNLYVNRKITGALVDVQPFGGFNMSGTDAKAGGREHLLQFLQAKSICERLIPGA
jgi:1-pyrroline-5-carboxylate dehydrogenase